ncbi:MAG TPA: AAA family ATPase [Ramlibacter sp.]|nr:AAA family ATPase [Ramlibacter sp.]
MEEPAESVDSHAGGGEQESVYESATTRVVRLRPDGEVRKEALGAQGYERIRREREILTLLSGAEGVVRLRGRSPQSTVLLLEDGGTSLAQWLLTIRLPLDDVMLLGEQLARALASIHRAGVTHCDICPSNIMLKSLQPLSAPTLIDFALAQSAAGPQVRASTGATGTLGYASPEQSGRTARGVDHRADLYSLGATLYELATGRPPFQSTDPLELMHDHLAREPIAPSAADPAIPAALSDIILRLLAKDPEHRYQSAEGLAHDLRRLRTDREKPFSIGELDFAVRLTAPARLVGRADEIHVIEQCLEHALSSTRRTLLIEGGPGVGKSALLQELRTRVQAAGGLFLYGKFDQYQKQSATAGGMSQALRSLARQLLSAGDNDRIAERERLVAYLLGNPGAAALLPEFNDRSSGPPPATVDADQAEQAMLRASVEVLRLVASAQRPVVLALDDLQWAGAISLRIFDRVMQEPDLEGLLLVGAHREPGTDAHALTAALARWAALPRAPEKILLRGLSRDALAELVVGVLRVPHSRARDLADVLGEITSGNPLEVLELVNALRDDGVLRLTQGGWQWDSPRAIRGFVSAGTLSQRLLGRIGQLPHDARAVLQAMSCLGTPVDMRLLQDATVLEPDELRALLHEPADDDLIVFDPYGGDSVQFRHDLIQQAVFTALDEDARGRLRLAMARRLAAVGSEAEAAGQYLECAGFVIEPAERESVARMWLGVARSLTLRGMTELAENYLARAEDLVPRGQPALHEEIVIERHAALVILGRLEEVDSLYALLTSRIDDPVRLAAATSMQVRSLEFRGRRDEALALCRELLARLGVHVPRDFGEEPLAAGLQGVVHWLRDLREGRCAPIRTATDPRTVAKALVISQVAKDVIGGSLGSTWARLESLRLWSLEGATPLLAAPLMIFAPMLANATQDFRAAFELGTHVLDTSRACGFPAISLTRMRSSFLSMCYWFQPLEDCADELAQLRQALQAAGDNQAASYASRRLGNWLLECESLEASEAEFDIAIETAQRAGHAPWVAQAMLRRRWVRLLRGKSLDEIELNDAHLRAGLPGSLLTTDDLWRAHADLIFGDMDAMLRRETLPLPLSAWREGDSLGLEHAIIFYAPEYARVALRCAEQLRREPDVHRAERLDLLGKCRAFLDARAADQRANFLHLAHLVRAEEASVLNDTWNAAVAFDAARTEARHRRRPWHKALIAERAAQFYLRVGMEDAGTRLMAEARELYADWGAAAKVRLMDDAYPSLRRASSWLGRSSSPTQLQSGAPSSDMLDLLGILRASQAISSQRTMRDLASRVTHVLAALTGATRVSLVVAFEDRWLLLDNAADELRMIPVAEAASQGLLPVSILRPIEHLDETLQVPDISQDDRFAHDEYFAGRSASSLLLVPVRGQGAMRAVLFLENSVARGAFGAQRLDAVMLIAGQLAVSLSNAQLNDHLEERVRERTEEIEKLQGELVATAHRSGMAQIATNVLHNVGNVLNSVTVATGGLKERIYSSRSEGLTRAVELMKQQGERLPDFIATDPRGKVLVKYLDELAAKLREEREDALRDVQSLSLSVEHIAAVVRSQQTLAGKSGLRESISVSEMFDEMLQLTEASVAPGTTIERDDDVPAEIAVDRSRLLQVLVNLVANAHEAMAASTDRKLTLGARLGGDEASPRLTITVRDSGHGIAPEHLSSLFKHGFTTKMTGHGFGLHSAAVAIMEMGGTLTAHSDGPGQGAMFRLEIPLRG